MQLEYVNNTVSSGTYLVDIDYQSAGNYKYTKIGERAKDTEGGIDMSLTSPAWNPTAATLPTASEENRRNFIRWDNYFCYICYYEILCRYFRMGWTR
jgi:hypothetical protein